MRCGASSSISEGSLVQCFYCGTKNVYSESVSHFNNYLAEILNIESIDKISAEVSNEEIERRRSSIESFFHEISSRFYDYKKLIITKIDEDEIDKDKLLKLIQSTGNLEVIIEELLLPHLKDSISKSNIQEIKLHTHIFNKSLLGLYFSYLAKEKFQLEDCSKFYQFSERNYESLIEYCDKSQPEKPLIDVNRIKNLYSILMKFVELLRNILTENPSYSSEKLEDLLNNLDDLEEKNVQELNLYTQIESVYHLGRDTSLLLEELRVGDLFSAINPMEENLIFNAEENLEKLDKVNNWITTTTEKYQNYQKSLFKLHSGKFIEYLETYRTEFTIRKDRSIEKYNTLLEEIINKALGDYNIETIEILDILSGFVQKLEVSKETIIQRFELEHDDLLKMGESMKHFVLELIKKGININIEADYTIQLINLISEKHTEFDKLILKYTNHLLKRFEDFRNELVLSLEDQRNKFILELKPNISRLIDASFTLSDDFIPYPLFIEIIMLSKRLMVDTPEEITVLIENPSSVAISNINVSFFVPNSFQSKLRFAQLKRIKPIEMRKIETEITPTEKGIFHFMVMVEYQHTNETFWMPSIRLELEVDDEF